MGSAGSPSSSSLASRQSERRHRAFPGDDDAQAAAGRRIRTRPTSGPCSRASHPNSPGCSAGTPYRRLVGKAARCWPGSHRRSFRYLSTFSARRAPSRPRSWPRVRWRERLVRARKRVVSGASQPITGSEAIVPKAPRSSGFEKQRARARAPQEGRGVRRGPGISPALRRRDSTSGSMLRVEDDRYLVNVAAYPPR